MKAIGYIRWSSDEQADGDSLNRQSAAIATYCNVNNLDLIETLVDEGLSASKGHHISEGKLGRFLADAEAGKYRGFALVIEYLDRLSRLGITQTFALVERLRKAGVEIRETQHNRIIRGLDDLATAVMTVVDSHAAHEYSKKLSERIGKAWGTKKTNAGDGLPLTRNVPDWIRIEGREYSGAKVINPGKFVVIPERAAAVREAFRLAALNVSTKAIAEKINGGRSMTWLTRTLNSRAVLGEYQPRDIKKNPVGEPIRNFYPAIITQSEYDAARKALSSRRRGGRLTNRGDQASNLFAGLVYDVTEEPVTMWFLDTRKNGRSFQYLVSSWKAGRKQNRMRYRDFESAFLEFLDQLDWKAVAGQTESDEQRKAQADLEVVLSDIDKTARRIAAKNAAMETEEDTAALKVLAGALAKDEAKMVELTSAKDRLGREVESAKSKSAALYNTDELVELIRAGTPEANEARLRLRAEIRKRVSRIDLTFAPEGTHAEIEFVNGAKGYWSKSSWARHEAHRVLTRPGVTGAVWVESEK